MFNGQSVLFITRFSWTLTHLKKKIKEKEKKRKKEGRLNVFKLKFPLIYYDAM